MSRVTAADTGPQRLDQAVAADDDPGVRRQDREEGGLAPAGDPVDVVGVVDDRDWSRPGGGDVPRWPGAMKNR